MSEVNPFKKLVDEERRLKKAEAEARAAEAQAKAVAKAAAKKKALRAVEDDWLFGEPKDKPRPTDDSEDDDAGFKMMDCVTAPPRQGSTEKKALKVVNLINFDECDHAQDEEILAANRASASEPYDERINGPVPASLPIQPPSPRFCHASAGGAAQAPVHTAMADEGLEHKPDSVLLDEIELLRQQLRDAQELGSIQVEIIQDEVVEKQRRVEELQHQRTDMKASLQGALQRIGELENQVQVAEAAAAAAKSVSSQAASTSLAVAPVQLTADVTALLSEALSLSARAQRALTGSSECMEQVTEAGDAEASLRALRNSVSALHEAAEATAEERRKLAARLKDVESLASQQPVKPSESQMVPLRAAAPTGSIGVGTDDGTLEAEAQAHAELLGRHAAQALREVRLNAEKQLALILKRITK